MFVNMRLCYLTVKISLFEVKKCLCTRTISAPPKSVTPCYKHFEYVVLCDICCMWVSRPYGDGCAAFCVTLRCVTLT